MVVFGISIVIIVNMDELDYNYDNDWTMKVEYL
jgi:hypothetical protein